MGPRMRTCFTRVMLLILLTFPSVVEAQQNRGGQQQRQTQQETIHPDSLRLRIERLEIRMDSMETVIREIRGVAVSSRFPVSQDVPLQGTQGMGVGPES